MFNTTILAVAGTQRHYHETIEKRAPTDESVKLLRDMEAKAKEEVVKAIRIENCPIDCVVHVLRDAMSDGVRVQVHAKINGSPIRVEVSYAYHEMRNPNFMPGDKVVSAFSEKIASMILMDAFRKLDSVAMEALNGR